MMPARSKVFSAARRLKVEFKLERQARNQTALLPIKNFFPLVLNKLSALGFPPKALTFQPLLKDWLNPCKILKIILK